ncbi:Ppx/GppA phosphatase [Frankia casuarinae]|uniref:Ppx/GppA phosphatase n=1 Tax=Frankia casuarinae (strain DSM 45818 / CECT 9043 / HFP020203 / CcI3) TaxID=106370 RepID=Q2J622_FRACC|nr:MULTISPECIES: Ppx/GppA family phosphatase [Frankia]ABD13270.1 Ppx/GppA phosphatase [Frankia casuarinae]ETA03859.1 Ppx/GppA phosphatase [Frankia sp. CcI6]EYT93790.1 Ppx/GppA phosphatase [Frankia casuarinae]KEZ37197.1 Ppx/GppA phosphatase [Frankia sp. CeD]KFB06431.1 Ppx/GppA phosphatase [Frankia sp. Allo2]
MSRVAAIDCGTNSIRLLVADVEGSTLHELTRQMEIVRLGAGVDRTGELAPEALARTFTALRDYAEQIERLGASRVRMVATSATRDARNRHELVAGVRAILGVDPEVISGNEEAALSFGGAIGDLVGRAGSFDAGSFDASSSAGSVEGAPTGPVATPILLADIGGGSTELVLGDVSGVRAARSVNVGCVRLAERHLHDDPPTGAQAAAIVADVHAALDLAARTVPLTEAATLVGVAGTVTTVAALAADLPEYDPTRIHLSVTTAEQVAQVTDRLLRMTHDQRAALPVMHPGRVDVIAAGALVLRTLVERTGAAAVVASERDILDGIALALAAAPGAPATGPGRAAPPVTAGPSV